MNVSRRMATEAAQEGKIETGKRVFIWFDNLRDGWRWDFEDSGWLGHCTNNPKRPAKLLEV